MSTSGAQRALVTAQLVSAVGDGAYYTCSALYFTHVVGLSAFRLGLGLAVGWTAGSVAGVPLGHLADRRGPRGTAVLFAFAAAAVVATFLVVRSFVPFLIAVSVYATAQSGLGSASQALVGALVSPAERTRLLARLQSTLNGGLGIGAALGGVALYSGTRAAFLGVFALDALSFVACGLILLRLPSVPAAPTPTAPGEPRLAVLHDRPYAVVALLNTVLLLRMPLLSLVIPLWIASRAAELGWLSSVLFALNTVAVLLFQVRTARAVTGLGSASRAVRRAGLLLLASCVVFAGSAAGLPLWVTGAVLVAAAVLQVVGEMHQSAGSWQISFDLAPAHRLGQYQGFFGSGVAVARTLGPLVLTTLLLTWGVPGWLLLGGLFAAAGCAMGPAVRWAERSRTTGPQTAVDTRAVDTSAVDTSAVDTGVAVGV
ncbi:MFS family permease [Streptacidiphilus sp. MAP12-33]|uniref:MFS transporter n=1 Tax=Streptacidiphilus sp. MAP12-33 TaxID=3156266 RepID=UPI003518C9A0